MILAADIGGTRIKLGLMQNRAVLDRESLAANSHEGLAPQLPRIASAFTRMLDRSGGGASDCTALGIAFPSLIHPKSGRVLAHYGKYEDAPDLDLRAWAAATLRLPLAIENDARAALLGECSAGAGIGCEDVVMVTLGTGLGTAALIGGQLLRGVHGQAGVLGGHTTVQSNGRPCPCGNRGCAEAQASTSVLPVVARQRADFAQSRLREEPVLDYAAVFRLARAGDACAVALRAEAVEVWTALLVNLIHTYDPVRVIVGGGILAGAADFLPELTAAVLARAHTPWGRVEIVPAALGDDAALFGCEALAAQAATHL